MFSNTKLLTATSLLIIISGFFFVWFGLSSKSLAKPENALLNTKVTHSVYLSATVSAENNIQGIEGEKVIVSKVIDGDTIELENGKKVRFVGMDTPETVDPRRPVGCFGKEASNETKSLLTAKVVILQKDISDTDKFGRLLRYIFLPLEGGQILFVNDYLVREGYAKVYTYPPDVKFDGQFREAEKQAKENKKGLWGKCQ